MAGYAGNADHYDSLSVAGDVQPGVRNSRPEWQIHCSQRRSHYGGARHRCNVEGRSHALHYRHHHHHSRRPDHFQWNFADDRAAGRFVLRHLSGCAVCFVVFSDYAYWAKHRNATANHFVVRTSESVVPDSYIDDDEPRVYRRTFETFRSESRRRGQLHGNADRSRSARHEWRRSVYIHRRSGAASHSCIYS